jgi:serine/threonine protein kinase
MNNPINPKEFSLLANLPAGKTLHVGEWEILDPLAKGGFGEAYLVRKMIKVGSSAFEVKAVLKLVRTNVPNVGAAVHSLLNEMRNLSQLNSRYIAKFIDGGVHPLSNNYFPYVVVDYIEGRSLRAQLVQRAQDKLGGLTPSLFKGLAENTLRALKSAHDKNLWHLDIKPENIIYNQADNAYVLIDFGLAQISLKSTINKFIGGTPTYISPEAYQSNTSGAADIFALGVTFYEALVGFNPIFRKLIEITKDRGLPAIEDSRFGQIAVNTTVFDFSPISDDQRNLIEPMLDPDPKGRPSLEKLIDLAAALPVAESTKQFKDQGGNESVADLWQDVFDEIDKKLRKLPVTDWNIVVDHPEFFQIWFKITLEEDGYQIVCNKPKDHLRLGHLGWIPNKPGTLRFLLGDNPSTEQVSQVVTDALRIGFAVTFPFDLN